MRRALLAAALVTGLAAALFLADFFVVLGLQRAGQLDSLAVALNSLTTLGTLPGLALGRALFLTDHHLTEGSLPGFFLVSASVSALLLGLAAGFLMRPRPRPPGPMAGNRRRFLRRAAGWSAAGGLAALGGFAVGWEPRRIVIRRHRLPLPGLPRSLDGLRLVQLSDLHLGWFTSAAYLRRAVALTNGLAPDLVLLTGDYVHGSPDFIAGVGPILAALRCTLGSVAVLGNHDHWEGAESSRRMLRRAGVRLLDNLRLFVGPRGLVGQQPAGGGLCLAGVGDLWEDQPDLEAALGGVDPRTPRLLLSHNPDFAETARARRSALRVDLMLCGHTHGGQVRLPGTRALITPSRYGARYARGFVRGPRFPVHVSAGLGMTILPVRFLVPPEIVVLELRSAPRHG